MEYLRRAAGLAGSTWLAGRSRLALRSRWSRRSLWSCRSLWSGRARLASRADAEKSVPITILTGDRSVPFSWGSLMGFAQVRACGRFRAAMCGSFPEILFARSLPSDPEYQTAKKFARQMADAGYLVITGAGGGIMAAGNEGAGRERSFGLNILLPFEQIANEVIAGDPKLINFRYFFVRKTMFVKYATAFVVFPSAPFTSGYISSRNFARISGVKMSPAFASCLASRTFAASASCDALIFAGSSVSFSGGASAASLRVPVRSALGETPSARSKSADDSSRSRPLGTATVMISLEVGIRPARAPSGARLARGVYALSRRMRAPRGASFCSIRS